MFIMQELQIITGYTHPWGVRGVLGLGSLEEGVAASRVEAYHWDLAAYEGRPCLALVEDSCEGHHDPGACHGNSCYHYGLNSSKEDDSERCFVGD